MGIEVLNEAIMEVEFRHGAEKGFLIEQKREKFLKNTTLEMMKGFSGRYRRRRYLELFNKPFWQKDE